MSTPATLYRFNLELSDIDRGIYKALDLRVARHPSEDEERLVVRVLAHAVADEDGLEFGRGLSAVEDAALWTRGPGGNVGTWIDVGAPTAERLHRASKAADRVVVVTHKPPELLRKEWSSRRIHRPESLEIIQLPPGLIRSLAEDLTRNEAWYVTLHDGTLSVGDGDRVVDGPCSRSSLASFLAG